MTINLLSPEDYNTLLGIYEKHPALSLQNQGYEYIGKNKLGEADRQALDVVNTILKECIHGFSEFSNFRLSKDGELQVRVQYDYSHGDHYLNLPFIGVGYVLLSELLNGFKQ
jgi:hypothetical protein